MKRDWISLDETGLDEDDIQGLVNNPYKDFLFFFDVYGDTCKENAASMLDDGNPLLVKTHKKRLTAQTVKKIRDRIHQIEGKKTTKVVRVKEHSGVVVVFFSRWWYHRTLAKSYILSFIRDAMGKGNRIDKEILAKKKDKLVKFFLESEKTNDEYWQLVLDKFGYWGDGIYDAISFIEDISKEEIRVLKKLVKCL